MPLLPSALPPKGEARRYVANDFLNLIALPSWDIPLSCSSEFQQDRGFFYGLMVTTNKKLGTALNALK